MHCSKFTSEHKRLQSHLVSAKLRVLTDEQRCIEQLSDPHGRMQRPAFSEAVDDEQQGWDGVDAGQQHRQNGKRIDVPAIQQLHTHKAHTGCQQCDPNWQHLSDIS